jgi:hypothetical protein
MSVAAETSRKSDLSARVETLSAVLAAGALTGALIGGVGGRLAMLILRLTSDPSLHGLETDDGFTIGIVSTSTLFLVGLTMHGILWQEENVSPFVSEFVSVARHFAEGSAARRNRDLVSTMSSGTSSYRHGMK